IAGEHLEECAERLAQRLVQAAFIDQRAVGAILEAFGHGEVLFCHPDNVKQGDLRGVLRQPDAAVAATNRLHEAGLHQRLENLEKEQLGKRVSLGNGRNSAKLPIIRRAIHEYANGIVGLTGESHEILLASGRRNMDQKLEQFQMHLINMSETVILSYLLRCKACAGCRVLMSSCLL